MLAAQCGLDDAASDTAFEAALARRLQQPGALFCLVSRFEQGAAGPRDVLAGILRSLSEMHSGKLHLLICGGAALADLKYQGGDLSLLNIAASEHWPELSVEDLQRNAANVPDYLLARALHLSGGHPLLAQAALTLLATPVWRDGGDNDTREGDVDILVIDTDTLAPRAWTVLPGALDSDAIFFDGMQLDTARYQLAPGTLAFGLRVQRRNGSGPNPFSEEQLQLLAMQAGTLRALGPPMVLRRFQAEWDTRCAGESTEVSRTVAVGPKGKHGMADLVLRERRVSTHSWMDGEECRDQDTPVEGERHVLRHDGRQYVVPEALRPL